MTVLLRKCYQLLTLWPVSSVTINVHMLIFDDELRIEIQTFLTFVKLIAPMNIRKFILFNFDLFSD